MKKYIFGLILFLILYNSNLYSHSGRTDSKGGHHDRINGGYHYHNNQVSGAYSYEKKSFEGSSNKNLTFFLIAVCLFGVVIVFRQKTSLVKYFKVSKFNLVDIFLNSIILQFIVLVALVIVVCYASAGLIILIFDYVVPYIY